MYIPKSRPMERPDPKEQTPKERPSTEELLKEKMGNKRKKYTIETEKHIWTVLNNNDKTDKTKRFEIKDDYAKPTLSLQWEIDFDALMDWMRNHMKAYPETQRGFYAEFLDDKQNRWYNVELWNEWERGVEEFDWRYYRITPTIFVYSKNGVIVAEVNSPKTIDPTRLKSKRRRNKRNGV